jgi:hypothetical protein
MHTFMFVKRTKALSYQMLLTLHVVLVVFTADLDVYVAIFFRWYVARSFMELLLFPGPCPTLIDFPHTSWLNNVFVLPGKIFSFPLANQLVNRKYIYVPSWKLYTWDTMFLHRSCIMATSFSVPL